MSSEQALAPGFYYIRTTESTPRDIINPGTDNQQLYVANSSTDLSHQWLVTGNGVIRSMDVGGAGRFAYANLASAVVPQAVTRSSLSVGWIINVTPISGSSHFQGTIIASDTTKRRLALNGNNVELARPTSTQQWVFAAV